MAKTDLTAQRLREILHYDPETGVFTWRIKRGGKMPGAVAGCKAVGKVIISIDDTLWRAHRLAWLYMTGNLPTNNIDHIDGNPHNNIFSNLRDVTQLVNAQNIRRPSKNNSIGVLGVLKHGPSWRASLLANGVLHRVGGFKTKEEAAVAYLELKRKFHDGCTI